METFSKEVSIQEYECDISKRMKISYFMRHAQQIGSDHLATKDLDYNKMYQDGMVFLVAKMLIDIKRRPQFGEALRLTTIPMQPKRVQFVRDTIFATKEGEELVRVSIAWVLIDPKTRKILRPDVFERYGFLMNPSEEEKVTAYRLKKPPYPGISHIRQIKYSDLDYNCHVNNAAYADIVCDYLPIAMLENREIAQFGIIYHKEAKMGQIMEIEMMNPERLDGAYYISADVSGEKCFEAHLSFQHDGKPHIL